MDIADIVSVMLRQQPLRFRQLQNGLTPELALTQALKNGDFSGQPFGRPSTVAIH
jgi:hypothetical protein